MKGITFEHCSFIDNQSTIDGGALGGSAASTNFSDCSFINNSTSGPGGVARWQDFTGDFDNCLFAGNSANGQGGVMGVTGIFTSTFTNCVFQGNRSNNNGGVFFIQGATSQPTFMNCSFSGNKGNSGAVILNFAGAISTFINCILWGNSSTIGGDPSTITYSIVEGGYAGTGNLNVDPLFVNQPDFNSAPTSSGDLSLQACSPAADAGTNTGAPAQDILGNSRPVNVTGKVSAITDMGAYEYQSVFPAPVAVCQSVTVLLDGNGNAAAAASAFDNGSTGCGPLGLLVNNATSLAYNCGDLGNNPVTLKVTDSFGRTASCTANVTVSDPIAPAISCPPNITRSSDASNCSAVITYAVPVGTDNCSGQNTVLAAGLGSGGIFPVGNTTETYTVTDVAGNTASCSFTVTVNDEEIPVLSLLGGDPIVLCEGDSYAEQGATATDNCDNNVGQNIIIDNSAVNTNQEGNYTVTYNVTDAYGNSAFQITRTVIVKHTPAQLAPQNCGSCSQIRFDFCEGEPTPDLEALIASNANYEVGVTLLWYADNSGSQGSPIGTPTVSTTVRNTNFYWVSQFFDGCEGAARRVRVRVRKTSTVILDLPAIGCNTGQLDLAAWVSDSRKIATGYTFYDSDPDVGSATALGSVTATKGVVNSGQYMIVNLPASPITYYATASNNTGCQVTGSDYVSSAAGASLDPVASQTVNAGSLVSVNFSSPNATMIIWFNMNAAPIGLIGNVGLGNMMFTASNASSSPVTAFIRAIAYNGNCAGQVRDFTITVNPGTNNRQAQNSLLLTASKLNAHDVRLNWRINYEFALSAIEIEKQRNDGEWATVGRRDMVGTHHDVFLEEGTHLDRGGMANETKYRLKLIHPDGRAIWSQEVEVNFDYFNSERFTLFPNPSDGRFQVMTVERLEGDWRYQLSDQLGRNILQGKLQDSETSFDIRHLPSGYYHLVMTSPEGKRYIERIVKN